MENTVQTGQVKLLNMWASAFGMRVMIALEEKGILYEYQEEQLPNKTPLLLQMNPIYQMIPVLIHNGNPISESLIIVQYIDETWPHHSLLPSQPYARAQARFWADFINRKLYCAGASILRSEGEEEAKRELLGCLNVLEGAFRDMSGGGGPYFGGKEFGFLDIAFIPFVNWCDAYANVGKFKIPWETQLPLLKAWTQKCMERESVKKVIPASERILDMADQIRKRFVTD